MKLENLEKAIELEKKLKELNSDIHIIDVMNQVEITSSIRGKWERVHSNKIKESDNLIKIVKLIMLDDLKKQKNEILKEINELN